MGSGSAAPKRGAIVFTAEAVVEFGRGRGPWWAVFSESARRHDGGEKKTVFFSDLKSSSASRSGVGVVDWEGLFGGAKVGATLCEKC